MRHAMIWTSFLVHSLLKLAIFRFVASYVTLFVQMRYNLCEKLIKFWHIIRFHNTILWYFVVIWNVVISICVCLSVFAFIWPAKCDDLPVDQCYQREAFHDSKPYYQKPLGRNRERIRPHDVVPLCRRPPCDFCGTATVICFTYFCKKRNTEGMVLQEIHVHV